MAAICVACITGCRRAGYWLVKEDNPGHADALILLMGDFPGRVMHAADLYKNGKAGGLIIVKESMGAYKLLEERGIEIERSSEQARRSAVALGIPEDSITVLPGDARSTLEESLVIRNYMMQTPIADTVILVSSSYHMRRASMIFRAAFRNLEQPVYVGSSPGAYTHFNAGRWWREKEDIQAVVSEYVKIASFVFFEKRGMNKKTDKQKNN
ncbi:MAG: YdcF family protein [Bacteroidales bacterium]|nr:YdcF family protein [Bacteroidales bacterium]